MRTSRGKTLDEPCFFFFKHLSFFSPHTYPTREKPKRTNRHGEFKKRYGQHSRRPEAPETPVLRRRVIQYKKIRYSPREVSLKFNYGGKTVMTKPAELINYVLSYTSCHVSRITAPRGMFPLNLSPFVYTYTNMISRRAWGKYI